MTISSQHAVNHRHSTHRASEARREVKPFEPLMKVEEIDDAPKKQRDDIFSLIEAGMPSVPQFMQTGAVQEVQPLPAQLEQLFEEMAVAMIFQTRSGEMETTLFFDHPDSLFHGTKITIREFQTAPRVFNVEIASHAAAIHCIVQHKASLLKALEEKKFNFSIHRLDTEIEREEEGGE